MSLNYTILLTLLKTIIKIKEFIFTTWVSMFK